MAPTRTPTTPTPVTPASDAAVAIWFDGHPGENDMLYITPIGDLVHIDEAIGAMTRWVAAHHSIMGQQAAHDRMARAAADAEDDDWLLVATRKSPDAGGSWTFACVGGGDPLGPVMLVLGMVATLD